MCKRIRLNVHGTTYTHNVIFESQIICLIFGLVLNALNAKSLGTGA